MKESKASGAVAAAPRRRRRDDAAVILALASWMFGMLLGAAWFVLSLALFPVHPTASAVSLGTIALLRLLPLDIPPPRLAQRFMAFSLRAAYSYFPVRVVFEDRQALEVGHPFVVGYEPHGVLPQGMCAFSRYPAEALPAGLQDARICVSSAMFAAPVIRHLVWWLGCQPASRGDVKASLDKGITVVVCPGGVQECLYMQPGGGEVAYLRKRLGFVRVALQHGAPLVPVFSFGQSRLYGYVRPFIDFPRRAKPSALWTRLVRWIGFVPLLAWGPRRVGIYIAVGAPLEMPRVAEPTDAQVEEHLRRFTAALQALFARHKEVAGYPDETLTIY